MNKERLKELLELFESKGGSKGIVTYSTKTRGGIPIDIEDEDVEGEDFKYDKHGNMWAIVKPENHPGRDQEYRPNRIKKKESSLLDNYDAGIFKKKKK